MKDRTRNKGRDEKSGRAAAVFVLIREPELIGAVALMLGNLSFLFWVLRADVEKPAVYGILAGAEVAVFCLCLELLSLYRQRKMLSSLQSPQRTRAPTGKPGKERRV